ncbi:glycosyltransferase [Microvirga sp. M2]|uniref:glycosyltransferase n=1 Tax=Microvirga sp. M2 TaxID=3073270 RepID=UPI0039C114AD
MSTYAAEKASNLKEALESMYSQTVPPDQMVLVLDGSVGHDQEAIIEAYRRDRRISRTDVLRLPMQQGLARALNAGLQLCKGTYVVRMDSDDISTPDRLAIQLAYFGDHPDTDVLSSWCEEFFEDGAATQLKICPVDHEAIIGALRWRNVLTHPALMIKADTLRDIGGYRAKFGKLEDYDLFVRLAQSGARFHAIPKVLVRMRSSIEQRSRRGGLSYCMHEVRFRTECFRQGFLSTGQFIATTTMYLLFRSTAAVFRRRAYSIARR